MSNEAPAIVPRHGIATDTARSATQPTQPTRAEKALDNFSRRPMSKRVGHVFESYALRHLSRHGLALVARNVRYRRGEIDLVMRTTDGTIVFVEVRARNRSDYGGALASVDVRKQYRLMAAARAFLATRLAGGRLRAVPPCRFDIVAFEGGQLTWVVDAFSEDPRLR
ncbi:YraN family protein [Mycetohabitans endofungorum]|uniref:YraN family protein n=1 Tax=Mycetohabitans endofungorum TaxID=417203 RepID=UPI002B0540CF|nr:YraN family protein [Mycetohabitans endofungorum]